MDEVQHTDARELAAFELLPVEAKLREIWLNGRETNGRVGDAMRDIAEAQATAIVTQERVGKLETWQIRTAAIVGAALVAVPIVFRLL